MSHKLLKGSLLALALAAPAQGFAQFNQEEETLPNKIQEGFYFSPMGTFVKADSDWPGDDQGFGGTAAFGYRAGSLGVELAASAVEIDEDDNSPIEKVNLNSVGLNLLYYPFKYVYGLAGAGYMKIDDFTHSYTTPAPLPLLPPVQQTDVFDDDTHYFQAGIGAIFPLSVGRYDFGIRAEILARHLELSKPLRGTYNRDREFADGIANVGLYLPLGLRPVPPPPPPPPAVVKPVKICADGLDNDNDGLIDYPEDPGCSSADDDSEIDPPQCSDGRDNDGDGETDYPQDNGCESASDPDETDPCQAPKPGERVSLKGCGTGDVIVLKGVNFDFDRSTLTADAKTILDGVADDLNAYPDLKIALGGHTDSKGSDSYNQGLSERRAHAVRKYLEQKGIAASRMTSAGYGESQPIADNATDAGRALNRRTELTVTEGTAKASKSDNPDGPSFEESVEAELLREEAAAAADE